MAYNRHTWTDRIIEFANRFRLTATADADVYDLERVTGEVTEAGTPITAAWLNEMEEGIAGKADEEHTHSLPDLDGVLPIGKGGTGAATRVKALEALEALGFRGALVGKDLDELYEPGMYYVTGGSAAGIVNSPFPNNAFALIVSSETDSAGIRRVQQFAARISANIFKLRSFVIDSDGSATHRDFDELAFRDGTVASASALATAQNFRVDLSSTASAAFDGPASCIPGVKNTLPVANGGTGATTKAAARTNLGAAAESHTHGYGDVNDNPTAKSISSMLTGRKDSAGVTGTFEQIGRRIVCCADFGAFTSANGGQTHLATIASGYRPRINAPVTGRFYKKSGSATTYYPVSGYIATSGAILVTSPFETATEITGALICFDFYHG